MEDSTYTYVNKFPKLITLISNNETVSVGDNHTNCESFKKEQLSKLSDKGASFRETCAKIAQYKEKIITDAESSEAAYCKYVNYWFYQNLNSIEKFSHISSIFEFFNFFKSLQNCQVYKEDIESKKYEEITDLIKLYDDFYKLKEDSTKGDRNSCTNGNECVKIYEQNVDECRIDYNNEFYNKLIEFKYEYDNFYTQAQGCRNKFQNLRPIKDYVSVNVLIAIAVMSAIFFLLFIMFKFAPCGSWLRPTSARVKRKRNKVDMKIQGLPDNSEMEIWRYEVPYHSS